MNKLTLRAVARTLKKPQSTLIFCHQNPDPDTLGSAFALKHILEHFGSSVTVACCDNASRKFDFITEGVSLTESFDIDSFQRVVAIDTGSEKQLGSYSWFSDRVTLIIDHHEMNNRFCDYYEDLAPATAMIVYDIARSLRILKKLPLHFFTCVYAGLSGDTGCFKYSNTTEKALVYASRLVKTGINFSEINRMIFDCKTVGEISAQRMVYDNMELLLDGRLAFVYVSNKLKSKYKISQDDISDIVNTIRQIQGVLVAVSVKQSDSDECRFSVSSRANADIDVSELCARLGGGGHTRAAGATIENSSESDVLENVKTIFSQGVLNYGN